MYIYLCIHGCIYGFFSKGYRYVIILLNHEFVQCKVYIFMYTLYIITLLALSYCKVRGLYFQAVVFATTINSVITYV